MDVTMSKTMHLSKGEKFDYFINGWYYCRIMYTSKGDKSNYFC